MLLIIFTKSSLVFCAMDLGVKNYRFRGDFSGNDFRKKQGDIRVGENDIFHKLINVTKWDIRCRF